MKVSKNTKLYAAQLLIPTERLKFLALLEKTVAKNMGNLVWTCLELDIQHRTLCRWVEQNKDVREAVRKGREAKRK